MSIVSQQVIGAGKLAATSPRSKRFPFSGADTTGEDVTVGYGGYTYAADLTQHKECLVLQQQEPVLKGMLY